jgi:hypothetical protein
MQVDARLLNGAVGTSHCWTLELEVLHYQTNTDASFYE